jgi:hypothetical protein
MVMRRSLRNRIETSTKPGKDTQCNKCGSIGFDYTYTEGNIEVYRCHTCRVIRKYDPNGVKIIEAAKIATVGDIKKLSDSLSIAHVLSIGGFVNILKLAIASNVGLPFCEIDDNHVISPDNTETYRAIQQYLAE